MALQGDPLTIDGLLWAIVAGFVFQGLSSIQTKQLGWTAVYFLCAATLAFIGIKWSWIVRIVSYVNQQFGKGTVDKEMAAWLAAYSGIFILLSAIFYTWSRRMWAATGRRLDPPSGVLLDFAQMAGLLTLLSMLLLLIRDVDLFCSFVRQNRIFLIVQAWLAITLIVVPIITRTLSRPDGRPGGRPDGRGGGGNVATLG